jgi:hypothetical protein
MRKRSKIALVVGLVGLSWLLSILLAPGTPVAEQIQWHEDPFDPTPRDRPSLDMLHELLAPAPARRRRAAESIDLTLRLHPDAKRELDAPTADLLIPALTGDPDPVVRAATARFLAHGGAGALHALPALLIASTDRHEDVRAAVAYALGRLARDERSVAKALARMATDPAAKVRAAAERPEKQNGRLPEGNRPSSETTTIRPR